MVQLPLNPLLGAFVLAGQLFQCLFAPDVFLPKQAAQRRSVCFERKLGIASLAFVCLLVSGKTILDYMMKTAFWTIF